MGAATTTTTTHVVLRGCHGTERFQPTSSLAHTMNGDNVRVRETGGHAGLPQKPVARLGITGEVSGQDLDRDVAIELHVAGEVHHSHASAAELALE